MSAFFKYLMGRTIKGQSPGAYLPSATRRVSGLLPINERSNTAMKRWNKLRQTVKLSSATARNLRAQEAAAKRRNAALLALVTKLNAATGNANKRHNAQKKRLYEQAKALNALRDPNYVNARRAAVNVHKKALIRLHGMRNQVVSELVRNATSSQIRRNLYAMGIERGRYGTSQNNWQNWTNKLWHTTEMRGMANRFVKPTSRA
jgi:hypothetical protein